MLRTILLLVVGSLISTEAAAATIGFQGTLGVIDVDEPGVARHDGHQKRCGPHTATDTRFQPTRRPSQGVHVQGPMPNGAVQQTRRQVPIGL